MKKFIITEEEKKNILSMYSILTEETQGEQKIDVSKFVGKTYKLYLTLLVQYSLQLFQHRGPPGCKVTGPLLLHRLQQCNVVFSGLNTAIGNILLLKLLCIFCGFKQKVYHFVPIGGCAIFNHAIISMCDCVC